MGIKNGDLVRVHYTGYLYDGKTQFDSSHGRPPLEFIMGQGAVIPGFERALAGKDKGASLRVTMPPEDAYGPKDERLICTVKRSVLPPGMMPEEGMEFELPGEGENLTVVVTSVSDDEVVLDGNHPLAGHALIFDIDVLDVESSSA